MGPVDRMVVSLWKGSQLYDWLRLKGYVAFNVPRTVTALGAAFLLGIVAVHADVLGSQGALPMYFTGYTVLMITSCLLTAAAIWSGRKPLVPQLGWFFGDLVSVIFLGLYLVSRAVPLPGLELVTGRWDFAPGTFAATFAVGFIVVHTSVLLGINVAYPHQQQWTD